MNVENFEQLKLEALRKRLQEGLDSPIVENFDIDDFLKNLHKQAGEAPDPLDRPAGPI